MMLKGKSHMKILAVCGSVAYGTAAEFDDIDLFIMPKKIVCGLLLQKRFSKQES